MVTGVQTCALPISLAAEIVDPGASRVLSRSPFGYAHVPAGVAAPAKALVVG
jgi:hypothetical protein